MIRRHLNLTRVPAYALGLVAVAACNDPFAFDGKPTEIEEEETCGASPEWLPTTPAMGDQLNIRPLPHPDSECPFYRGAWQNFLIATQPDEATGDPAIVSYPVIDEIFDSANAVNHAAPRTQQRSWLGDIKQAGQREILIDQNGHTIYYGIHVNDGFASFINDHGMRTADGVRAANPRLFFPGGIVEFKSAWQEVDGVNESFGRDDPQLADYITTKAWVPTISQHADSTIVEDRNNARQVWVRLLALHVVFTLPGHPEFIWGTFEHTDRPDDDVNGNPGAGERNVAPLDPRDINPSIDDPLNQHSDQVASDVDHILYKAGTMLKDANKAFKEAELVFNATTQTFDKPTSVYRMFPGSKSNTTHPDDAITSLNFNVQQLFKKSAGTLHAGDRRGHYRLVGAQWLDKPRYFDIDRSLQNDMSSPRLPDIQDALTSAVQTGEFQGTKLLTPDLRAVHNPQEAFEAELAANGSDSEWSITAGEDRLSSTSMESFTQQPGSFQNCFTCHNTQAIQSFGVPCKADGRGIKLLDPKLLNVSHVLSQFLLEECGEPTAPSWCRDACQ